MPRLYHPDLDVHIDVAHPKTVAVHKRSGWIDSDSQEAAGQVADEVGDTEEDSDLEGDD